MCGYGNQRTIKSKISSGYKNPHWIYQKNGFKKIIISDIKRRKTKKQKSRYANEEIFFF